MPTPQFIEDLREKIGQDLLWLTGVTAVVLRDAEAGGQHAGRQDAQRQVLLCRRSDNDRWTPITGIVEPGEQPATTAMREVMEETGVSCTVDALARVRSMPPQTHANGDRAQYMDLTFRCTWVDGDAHPADEESTAVAWRPLGPDGTAPAEVTDPDQRARIEIAAKGAVATQFLIDQPAPGSS